MTLYQAKTVIKKIRQEIKKYLQENKVRIWNEWADEAGELGPVYGKQWRSWEGADGMVYDQVSQLVRDLKEKPDSPLHPQLL